MRRNSGRGGNRIWLTEEVSHELGGLDSQLLLIRDFGVGIDLKDWHYVVL